MKLLLLLVAFAACVQGASYNRRLLQSENSFVDDAQNEIEGLVGKIWGGQCISDDQCTSTIAHCSKEGINPVGVCRPVWWAWVILAAIALLLVLGCLMCICLPCCICYSCCSMLLDCLCCCCRGDKGYTPANRG